ncbi:MAG: CytX-like hydroxymethylpyrimidine transporter protein [Acidobacteria bacterium]|nr:CytX-like hydroxymethylpyrimidine transporter protein [Acidobacteriota bacterium]
MLVRVNAADIRPAAPDEQTQSTLDLFLIFVGANVVATTFQVGASLSASFTLPAATALIAVGSVGGAALVAALAPLGPRLRVPSVIAARPALGIAGAGLVAVVLYVSNFAWIALNNVIAASACARVGAAWLGPAADSPTAWAILLGLLATFVVWLGPRAVARADRIAVPSMLIVAVALTIACLRAPLPRFVPSGPIISWFNGLDVVVGYQVSWILMFADYSRYTRSVRGSGIAVFLGLAITSAWMMPLGAIAARAAGTSDPGAMLDAVGLGTAGAVLLTLATLTTNFVNIYMSSLAWKSLMPRASDGIVIWSIGGVGTALSAVPGVWLAQYTNFMTLLGAVLVPVGGILVAHYYIRPPRIDEGFIAELYDPAGRFRGVSTAGVIGWAAGAAVFFAAGSKGGTLPALAVSILVYRGVLYLRER